MEETNECKDNIPCEGATASENLTSYKPTEEERELFSNLSVDKAKKLKSSKLSLKIDIFKSPESSDLIKPLEEMNLFELQSLRTTDLVKTSKMSEQSVKQEVSEQSVKQEVSEQSVKPKVSEQFVRPKLSEQCERPKVSKQSVRSSVSEPSVRPKLSKSLFKTKIFKPFSKNKLTISEPSETFELSEPSEKFKLTETLVESKMFEPSVKSKLSDPSVESKLSDSAEELKLSKPQTKSKFSKLFTSKIFKPFTKNKLSISEPGNLYESSNLSEAAGKIKLLESPVKPMMSEAGVKTKFKSPAKPNLLESAMPSKITTSWSGTKESASQLYESNKTLDHFLELRRSYIIVLYKETIKVKTFIDEVEKFKPPYRKKYVKNDEMLYASDASDWANLHAYWDSFKNHITELIQVIKELYIDSKMPISLTIEEFQDLVELLIYVFIDMRELCEICQNGLDKYRRLCFYYNEYLFLVYASTFNSLVSSLREKMRIELNEFKIIEEKVLGLK